MNFFMTTREVAAWLNVSLRKFEQMVAEGDAPKFRRFGRLRRWDPDEVDAWATERDRSIPPETEEDED